jgi:hypothetical protein
MDTMKTDNELNRLIAERVLNEPLEPPCGYYHETDAAQRSTDGWSGWCYNCDCSISEVAPEPRRYCTDPAARDTLEQHLIATGHTVVLYSGFHIKHTALVGFRDNRRPPARGDDDTEKGHALVLATLAAYGVDIDT